MTATANKKPRTAVEEWNRAVREAYLTDVDEPSELAEQSPADVEKDLVDAGFDLAALDAFADSTYERALAKFGGAVAKVPEAKESSPESLESSSAWVAPAVPIATAPRAKRSARARNVVWLAAAAAAAATGGAVYLGSQHKEEPKPEPPPVNKPAPSAVAPPAPPPPPVDTAPPQPARPLTGDKAPPKGSK